MAENTLSVLKIAPGQHPQQVEIFRRRKMSETSVMNAMDDALPSIGYLNVHGICRRTYGKETKAHTDNPHFPTHNVNWGYPTQERLKRLWL